MWLSGGEEICGQTGEVRKYGQRGGEGEEKWPLARLGEEMLDCKAAVRQCLEFRSSIS